MHTHHRKPATAARTGSTTEKTPPQTPVAACEVEHNTPAVSADDVRLCAYRKWERAGRPIGDGMQFWLEAERELKRGK